MGRRHTAFSRPSRSNRTLENVASLGSLRTVMYLVRVMLLGILSVRTIKERNEMPVVKSTFSFWKKIEKYTKMFDEREHTSDSLVDRCKTETKIEEFVWNSFGKNGKSRKRTNRRAGWPGKLLPATRI